MAVPLTKESLKQTAASVDISGLSTGDSKALRRTLQSLHAADPEFDQDSPANARLVLAFRQLGQTRLKPAIFKQWTSSVENVEEQKKIILLVTKASLPLLDQDPAFQPWLYTADEISATACIDHSNWWCVDEGVNYVQGLRPKLGKGVEQHWAKT